MMMDAASTNDAIRAASANKNNFEEQLVSSTTTSKETPSKDDSRSDAGRSDAISVSKMSAAGRPKFEKSFMTPMGIDQATIATVT
jgi:hypothetical protein